LLQMKRKRHNEKGATKEQPMPHWVALRQKNSQRTRAAVSLCQSAEALRRLGSAARHCHSQDQLNRRQVARGRLAAPACACDAENGSHGGRCEARGQLGARETHDEQQDS
jgi:hypothetical protein